MTENFSRVKTHAVRHGSPLAPCFNRGNSNPGFGRACIVQNPVFVGISVGD